MVYLSELLQLAHDGRQAKAMEQALQEFRGQAGPGTPPARYSFEHPSMACLRTVAYLAIGESKADATLDPPTLAAYTMLANQLLNLDEVLNK